MGLILATLSALIFGSADYCGGRATRTVAAPTVTFTSQACGLAVLAVAVVLVPANGPSIPVLAWGAAGGFCGAVGLLLLYGALSTGTMSVVSPVCAVSAASVPVVFGVVFVGERPSGSAYFGIVAALIAIAMVSRSSGESGHNDPNPSLDTKRKVSPPIVSKTVTMSMLAGLGFGAFFVLLNQAGDPADVGLWALVGARPSSMVVAAIVAFRTGRPLVPARVSLPLVAAAGVLDQGANALYVLALGSGDLSVLGVLASLYPVSTVALARILDHETLNAVQKFGVGLAFFGIVLIAI